MRLLNRRKANGTGDPPRRDGKDSGGRTPQGRVFSPLLANLFRHYAFGKWMERNYLHIHFERYANDVAYHCKSEEQAPNHWQVLKDQFIACNLTVHLTPGQGPDCLLQTNETRQQVSRGFVWLLGLHDLALDNDESWGQGFFGFNPAVSRKAAKAIRESIRGWGLAQNSPLSMEQIVRRSMGRHTDGLTIMAHSSSLNCTGSDGV